MVIQYICIYTIKCNKTYTFEHQFILTGTEYIHDTIQNIHDHTNYIVNYWKKIQDTGRSVVLFPIGRADDGAHGPNEKYDVAQFMGGIKALGTYLEEYAAGCSPKTRRRSTDWAEKMQS